MVYAIYFSPTHGTRACVRMAAELLDSAVQEIDLTLPHGRSVLHEFAPGDRVVVGVPVYCGRIPQLSGLFDSLRGNGAGVLLIAVYGNRAYEDALRELSDRLRERGFRPAGAAAMLAPHCYVPREVCPDRPDAADRDRLSVFLRNLDWTAGTGFVPPGNFPYKPFPELPFLPETGGECTRCRRCEAVCPTAALKDSVTDSAACIRCMACVQSCPVHCRSVEHPVFAGFQEKLRGLAGVRKEVELFC